MNNLQFLKSKIIAGGHLEKQLSLECFLNQRIVFTNGCFDILHRGHIEYLSNAADLGDKLIVGLNSDSSVKRLKGDSRPINQQDDRALLLASLSFVDRIVIFEDDTPLNLIEMVRPHILVKGGDWQVEEIIGNEIVNGYGGQVLSIPFVKGYSTTSIINQSKTTR